MPKLGRLVLHIWCELPAEVQSLTCPLISLRLQPKVFHLQRRCYASIVGELVYGDRRASPKGRLPDDTWILRPQDLATGFNTDEDTWYFLECVNIQRTFRLAWVPDARTTSWTHHPVIERSKRSVIDPFAEVAQPLAVAKKLGRSYLGFELSADYERAHPEAASINMSVSST